jgi:hypothetical protein
MLRVRLRGKHAQHYAILPLSQHCDWKGEGIFLVFTNASKLYLNNGIANSKVSSLQLDNDSPILHHTHRRVFDNQHTRLPLLLRAYPRGILPL